MTMNRTIEANIEFNADSPEAVKDLKAIQRLYNGLRDSGRVRELPEDWQTGKESENPIDLTQPVFEHSLRYALLHLDQPTSLINSRLLTFPKVRQKIFDFDQLDSVDKSRALKQLLVDAIESIKTNPRHFSERTARNRQNAYEALYQTAILGRTNEQAEEDLFVSRMTLYRRKKLGIQSVAEFLLSKPE